MKKIFLGISLISCLFLTGCGFTSEKSIRNDFIKEIEGMKSYYLKGKLSLTNNDDVYQYDVEVGYMKDDNYRVRLVNEANQYEQIILRNNEGIYVVTPSLNKSFKFQSEWPYNNSQSYLLNSVASDLKKDEKYGFKQKDNDYVFTVGVNYPNNKEYVKQEITIDKNKKLKKVEVFNKEGVSYISFVLTELDKKPTFNDDYFKLDDILKNSDVTEDKAKSDNSESTDSKGNTNSSESNIEGNEDAKKEATTDSNANASEGEKSTNPSDESNQSEDSSSATTSKLDESIFPLYLPENTSLSNKEVVSTDNGKRIIMTFAGDNPFILVEETVKKADEHTVIPTYGEPFMLIDTVGSLTDVSYTWTSNGVEYYIVSDTMEQDELLQVAKSIGVVSVVNEK